MHHQAGAGGMARRNELRCALGMMGVMENWSNDEAADDGSRHAPPQSCSSGIMMTSHSAQVCGTANYLPLQQAELLRATLRRPPQQYDDHDIHERLEVLSALPALVAASPPAQTAAALVLPARRQQQQIWPAQNSSWANSAEGGRALQFSDSHLKFLPPTSSSVQYAASSAYASAAAANAYVQRDLLSFGVASRMASRAEANGRNFLGTHHMRPGLHAGDVHELITRGAGTSSIGMQVEQQQLPQEHIIVQLSRKSTGERQLSHLVVDSSKQAVFEELRALALAVATFEESSVRQLAALVSRRCSLEGDPLQRLAWFMREALLARCRGEGMACTLTFLATPHTLSSRLLEVSMCRAELPFAVHTANLLIIDAAKGCHSLHIVDVCPWHTTQWRDLFVRMARLGKGKPPRLRITRVSNPPAPHEAHSSQQRVVTQAYEDSLRDAALTFGVNLHYSSITAPLEALNPAILELGEGETLIVNALVRLHTLFDDSVMKSSPRDAALRVFRAMRPSLVLVAELDVDLCCPFFMRRFNYSLTYYCTALETMDLLPRDSAARAIFEKAVWGVCMMNSVACEGLQRVTRVETCEQWSSRMVKADYSPVHISDLNLGRVSEVVSRYGGKYEVVRIGDFVHLLWDGQRSMFVSAWQPLV